MRLTKIKISGFKSFVDKTEISLAEKRTAIIGPNGCGKSNIIDAVKWVLGDTSKHIRGDNIDDVIFNGTDTRKPNDYANVELLFSNTENRIGGQYAQYDEISVKREVTRDGASKYFLNNSHCRRRDILDIFMGTGLGPKSYAIINQGTASKLIESKPEEFRVYLEEVAGISKYRERKRETENKIRHTKENLDRLNDVVSEVSKQLKTLERQAIQADKYKKLTEEKKVIKSEILAISIRDFQESIEIKNNKIETKRTKLEKKQSEISSINAQEEKLKITYQSLNEEMNETQKQYYNALSEVGRTEQAIEYEKDGAERNKKQYQNALESIEKIRNVLNTDNDKLTKYKSEINELGETKNIKSLNISKMKKDKDYINNDLLNKKEILEVETKKIYESEQSIKNKEEKIKDFNHNIIRIKKDIEEYTITSQKILTELKNIESYELDNKIKEYDLEIKIFKDNINSLDNKDIITSANKIQDILKKIKDVVKTIQSSEFDLAKKNEQIKNDIDNKITSEINRLDTIVKDDMQNKDSLSRLNNEVKILHNTIIDSKNNLDKINKNLNTIISDLTIENNSLHSVELKMETKKVEINNLVQNIENNNNELKLMTGNIELLKFSDTSPDSKLSELKESLSEGLKIQNIKDNELKEIRSSITDLSDKILLLEDSKIKTLNDVDEIKSEISEDEKNIQEIVGQVKIIKEQLEELEVNSKSILDVDINYDLVKWKKRENELITIIDRMGAINLAAIDQFKEYDERKSYLIMQKEDLLSALNSLEEAIRKIDKDTKERFKNTFDQVNLKLQEIFPKLFNGGKAYLKMTENDLLKTGVAVFASPPGKKLTSINLLSGGEKALTALSLVFALFSLNPSPFCMLDEVDAPLDDVNIERFCNLFTEMSEKIQFIIITHKKITMEYVEQLIGVTMGEKGVSKLVNVSMQDVGMQDQI
ncbi:MAG: AAA family ATPase [Gammaproteobacteria bacterium]|nr:AAA family ATPase [Gammaproteobacteria bacterium]